MTTFNVKTIEREGIHFIEVNGDLDNETYVSVEKELKELLHQNTSIKVLIDFTGVYGFCSAAEFVLVWANDTLKEKGGKLGLLCGNKNVMELMVAFGLDKMINIFEDKQTAISFLNS
jgi:anti-anti-sigma factor